MSNPTENVPSYVLFGKFAVDKHDISIDDLLNSRGIFYNVGKFNSVKGFSIEAKKWKSFKEISYIDYKTLKRHLDKMPDQPRKPKKRFSFFSLFD